MRPYIEFKNVVKQFGNFTALDHVSLEIPKGAFVTLLGPSGCGKTTLMRQLAGFSEPESGDVLVDGKRMNGLPPFKRNTPLVFQEYALFPHMTVYENISYGLKLNKTPKEEMDRRVQEMLKMFNLVGLEKRFPKEMSGGQQQRVAFARALVMGQEILLLDEPLSNLDAKLRVDVRTELRQIQQKLGITTIYVTHDQEEALSMSDTVVVMNNGEIQQIGSPTDIYNEPENRFVAGFIGESNIIEGTMIHDYLVAFDGFEFECVDKGFEDNEEIEVVLRPEDLDIVDPGQAKIRGIVRNITFKGVHYEIIVTTKYRDYRIDTTDYFAVGLEVGLTFTPEDIHVMWQMGSY